MTLSILSTALVSPFGFTPREHVMWARADLPAPTASPFLTGEGERLRVFHCPWLDPHASGGARAACLAKMALEDALAPLANVALSRVAVHVIASEETADEVLRAVDVPYPVSGLPNRCVGAAGVFVALSDMLASSDDLIHVLVAADSRIDLLGLERLVRTPITRWESVPPSPSEAAAVLVLASPARAGQLQLQPLGRVHRAGAERGAANDRNDVPVDAVAMTKLLAELGLGTVHHAVGQDRVNTLRFEDWHRAVARHRDSFRACQHVCWERSLGSVGASAGAVSVVLGLWMLRMGTAPPAEVDIVTARRTPFVAWALSSDGTRGAATVSLRSS